MRPGWHTYWRYPGNSGVPPRFHFPGSDNVAAVKVLYPAPHAYTDEAGTTIGYKNDVIFPLRVVPRQKGKPVTLHLKAEYAVCEKLCVPVEASATLCAWRQRRAQAMRRLPPPRRGCPKLESAAAAGLDRAPRQRRGKAAGGGRSAAPRPAASCMSSSRGRRRSGRCPSPSRRKARRPGMCNSASISTDCRPASIRRARSN